MPTDPSGLFATIEASAPAMAIAGSDWAFPLIETAHVVGVALVIGSILLLDLALLGVLRFPGRHEALQNTVLPWTWGGFVLALLTGMAMFASAATRYATNIPFLAKMALLMLAGVNMAFFNSHPGRPGARRGENLPGALRASAGISLCAWLGVVVTGRWIGFV
ncbi:hypothetical protein H7F51_00680 [Novosphingobium flavum]|uniref:DUF6644 domain-containing protein n=1 Tax=Novosphingobium flavum TaxID=1778672 RepID=A0A7X1FND8_9SPHN|nr:DUF6644 family protein [Novosphingobium flavum]MBC2664024.1 hypothetical protein [Novosphingobium flavum]